MKIYSVFLVIFILTNIFVVGISKSSETEKVDDVIYKSAELYAKCAALYDAFADYNNNIGEKEEAKLFLNLSYGAKVVAGAIAKAYGGIQNEQEFVAGIHEVNLPYFQRLLKNFKNEEETIMLENEICKSSLTLQAQMLQEIRKKAYGFDTAKNKFFK